MESDKSFIGQENSGYRILSVYVITLFCPIVRLVRINVKINNHLFGLRFLCNVKVATKTSLKPSKLRFSKTRRLMPIDLVRQRQ